MKMTTRLFTVLVGLSFILILVLGYITVNNSRNVLLAAILLAIAIAILSSILARAFRKFLGMVTSSVLEIAEGTFDSESQIKPYTGFEALAPNFKKIHDSIRKNFA